MLGGGEFVVREYVSDLLVEVALEAIIDEEEGGWVIERVPESVVRLVKSCKRTFIN